MTTQPRTRLKSLLLVLCLVLCGCNVNESKEGRIRSLEADALQTKEKLQELEDRISTLEDTVRSNRN